MKDKISKKRKKYGIALLAATAATVGTSFSPSAPWVMASESASNHGTTSNVPPEFSVPVYNELKFDPDEGIIRVHYYNVQAGDNVTVKQNTFTEKDFDGNDVTYNNFIVKANDTLVEDSDDIVVDTGNSENPEKGTENGVTRKYKLKLSETLKKELKASAGGGGGAAPSKLEKGSNTTVEGDGTEGNKYKVNINPELTGITSITGDTGLTFTGAGTAVTINGNGVNVGGAKVTNLADAALTGSSSDAVTGKQLHATNEKVEGKLDKTAERHIKPGAYTVENGTVTLTYVDGDGNDAAGKATITGLNAVKSVTSGDESKLTVANNNGAITVTPVVATDVTATGDANKLATAGVVNTAINNATSPLANKALSNITDAGKKVITGLSTEVVQGDGVTVTPNEDATTGKKTYTISALKPKFAAGTNTTLEGDGTTTPYKYNVNPALTGITSITGDTGLTFTGAGTAVTINGNGVNVGGAKVTNLADAALTNSSSDAVTGKQLHETNEKVEGKLDKTAERHIKPEAYTVNDGTVTLKYVDANGKVTDETATISGLNPVKSVASGDTNTLTVANNDGAITVTPVVATNVTDAGNANKLTTASVVNTAINNATSPLANKALSNITDAGKKVITGLSTEVVQGDGVTVTPNEDATTGKKTYTISALKPKFAAGTNTTLEGDGTTTPYKYNVNPALTGITSITGDTGLTFTGAGTAVTINGNGVNVGGAKVTNLADAALTNSSSDAVTGKQLHETNEKVEGKLDKTAERHIKPQSYSVENGTVTLKYVDANGKETTETATINGLNPVKSVASGDESKLTVANNNGDITVTPVVATDITKTDDTNKLATAGVVNTAITNATNPLANKALSNITDDGKKVITGLGTEVVQGDGVTVTHTEDGTGKKTYTVSAVKPNFDKGTNTTVTGNGTVGDPYKYNVNPALTGITSITGDTGLTFTGAGKTVTINNDGVNVGGAKVTNLADAALTNSSSDAVTGKQLNATNEKVEGKVDKTAERHIKAQGYTVENGTVTLHYVDAEGKDKSETATISGLNPVKSVASGDANTLTVENNNGAITVTPVVATNVTDAGNANKLTTASVVNTAINNATSPLANKALSNITDDGKKVITGLSTEVVQGNGVTVTSSEDASTGKKTYTISANAAQPNFANGTNTTVEGNGTTGSPYKYNVNPALTGITSITNATTADGDGTKLTIDGDKLSVVNKKGTDTTTVTIGNDGINAGGKTITNVADPTGNKDVANKAYVDAQKWGLKVQNGTDAAADVTPNTGKITLKTGTDTSDDATKPKKGLVIAKDDQGNITLGLEKADRTTLDNAANLGNTASDGRDGQAGKNATGVVAGSAGAQGPTGKDGLNGKDLTNKVNALRNGEAGTVVYTNAAGDRLVKANDGQYYKADEVEPNGEKKPGATAVPTKDVIASLVSPEGNTTGATTKLSNIADGAISKDSKDAVNGSQLFNERVTSPVIFVDKDGNQVFKTANGKFVTKEGTAVADADLDKVHTKVNADKAMTLDNVASAVTNLTGNTYLDKLAEGAKADNKVANSAVNVTDLHNTANAIVEKGLKFKGNLGEVITKKLGEELDIVGEGTVAETVATAANNIRTKNVGGKLEIGLVQDLKNITSITNAAPVDPTQPDAAKVASTTLTINGDALTVENKQADGKTATVKIGKDGIDAGGKTITNVADPTGNKDAANKEYVDAQKWGLKVQNGTDAAADVTPNTGKITLKTGTDTSDDATKPKKGLVIAKDDQGNITLGLEKADRTTLDNAANLGNTASDGRDGKAGKDTTGVVAGSAGAQGPTGKDGLNGKDLTSKVNALRNGEAGIVVYTNAAGDRLVKANDGQYYKANEVEPNGEKKQGATAVPTKDVIASLVSPEGNTTGATTKLSNIADGAISKDSKDAVNGSQLFNERVTSPVIFVDKDGKQVFKTADGKFTTKDGAEITNADDLAKIHTKVNADKAMTLDNVASALGEPAQDADYLAKLKEAKEGNTVNNSAVNVTDLHNTANAIVEKGLKFKGNLGEVITKKLGEELDIVGEGTVAETVATAANNIRTKNVGGKLEIGLVQDLTGITSITGGAANNDTKIELGKTGLKVTNTVTPDAGGAPETKTITIGKDGIDAGNTKITNVATPADKADAANKAYVDAQKWGLKVQNGTDAAADVTPNTGKITLKTGTDTSDDATKPKKGLVIAKDDQGNITLGLEKADRTTLDNAANLGNTASDGRDGKAGKDTTGVVAGSAGAQGPTGKDGLNGKDLTNKVNALRNGEAGTVVYTNAAGDRLVKANDGNYYKANEVGEDGQPIQGATAVDKTTVIASLVSPDGKTTGATTKLSNIADGAISKDSKDAVNGSQLFNERVTSPVIFVDKDGKQVFKTADGKFTTKDGAEITNADDLAKVHTKVNADKAMTLDNVASAVNNLTGNTYLDKLAEGAKADNKVANSAVNVTDLHAATTAILDKPITFIGDNDTDDKIERKLGETLKIHGDNNITVKKDAANADTLNVALQPILTGITSITNARTADGDGTKLTIDGDKLSVVNKKGADTTTVKIGKDGIDAGGKTITNVADPTGNKDAANKAYVDAQKWGLKVQNGTDAAADVTPNTGKITLKTGTDTSDDATKPKKGLVIAKDDQGNITLGLEKADRTTLDNAANLGNTASDGRDGKAGKDTTGVVAGSAGAQGPTGKDGLNGKDLTNKVNALRNGEAGTVVYTNAAGDRLVKANDGNYYKANEVGEDGQPIQGATAVDKTTVIASLVSPDGKTTGATTKLSNIADGAISKDSKDAVNGSQLFNERVTSPVIFVDKDGNQVFKTANGKFVTKEGTAVADADLDKVHTKVNADKAMTLDNVASAVKDLAGTTYLDKLAEGAKQGSKVANSAVNVTDLHSTANALVTKGLEFKGNLGDAIHKNLGETLEIVGEGTVATDATTAANNIRTKKTDDGKLEIGLVKDLTGITSITGGAANNDTKIELGKTGLKVTNTVTPDAGGAVETKTITIGKDGIDAGNTKITNVATPTDKADAANKEYVDAQKWGLKVQNGTDAATDVTPANKVVTFKTGTGTVAPTNLPAGQDSPTKDTDNVAPKKGIVLETDNQGNVTIGLEKADRTTLDHAANIGNTASDGRDGQAGAGKDGVAVAGSAGVQGPTGKDGLNGKDLTSKVNALRNGEAGTVVYTNAAGDRVVKANDGNYYKADEVKPDGNVKTETENGGKAPVAVTPEARLVNPDGTTTGATNKLSNIANGTISESSKDAVNGSQLFNERVTNPTIFVDKDGNQVFKTTDGKFVDKNGAEVPADKIHTKLNAGAPMTLDNVASAVENATVPNAADPNNVTFKEKLAAAAADVATKHSAVNVEDLHKATADTSDALVTKGLNFQGNLGDAIHKDLGAKLDIVGEGTVAADATTAADNIRTKNVDGKLEIGIVKDLKNITSITNATTADGDGTKLTIDGDKLSVVNKKGTDKTTVTIGKDGINAGGTKITNVAEGAISKDSTDVVIGKQLHATNEKVSNLEETKLNKTDDVHVKAGTYTVDDTTGTVALPLVKGDTDTATGKNVTISGIVTHAALSNTMDAYELHIAGDKDSKATTTLKKGLAVRGAENFTPDTAAQEKGINIQATATEGGVNIKLSDTLTKMKGITFTPAENSKEAVSLTSNGLDNGGHTITNVAAGQNDTDVVNVAQLKGIANVVGDVNNRLNRSSAQSAALAGLQTLQYDPLEPTQISAGVGYYKGSTALALGVGHYKNESTLFHVGASVNGHGDEVMANASVTWKFGSRATESAVKDAYRQGPISASYTLQDKVSALEAQNQLQSEKIKAQNQAIEDLKAQLAEVLQYIKK